MTRVLIVEDDPGIQELLAFWLRGAGYEIEQVVTAERGLDSIRGVLPDLALIDWMLPGMSGLALAQRLRADRRTRALPIIILTARGEEQDKLDGLDVGADDNVTKPFSPKELLARIKAVLRRRSPENAGDPLVIGPVELNPASARVRVGGREVPLGPTEYKLLQFFMANPDRAFSRDQVLDRVWGDHRFVEARTVDAYIRRLRSSLHEYGVDGLIETVRGVGYRCAPESVT